MKRHSNLCTITVVIFATLAVLIQQGCTTKDEAKLKVQSNPEQVGIELRTYNANDAELQASGFREGWYSAEPFGPGHAANPNPSFGGISPNLTDFQNLEGVTAVVVGWKVKAGQNLAPDALGPQLRGVTRVPERYAASLTRGSYKAVATKLDGLGLLVQTKASTGEFAGAFTQREGVAWFLWFVPDDTGSLELILPPHKAITISKPGSQ